MPDKPIGPQDSDAEHPCCSPAADFEAWCEFHGRSVSDAVQDLAAEGQVDLSNGTELNQTLTDLITAELEQAYLRILEYAEGFLEADGVDLTVLEDA